MTILLPLFPATVLELQDTSVEAVDIDTGFTATDLISMSLPDFPATDIDFEHSLLELTSHPDGEFAQGPTAAVKWSLAETIPVADGNCSLDFRRSHVLGINKKQVTGVRLRIVTTADCEVRCLGIRMLKSSWLLAPQDLNTRKGRLVRPASKNGGTGSITFPTSPNPPTEWPILWRADTPSSTADPAPVDAKMNVTFYSGTMVEDNQISIFFREVDQDYITQLELNGDTQGELNDEPQPDFGESEFMPRKQLDLDGAEDTIPGAGGQGQARGMDQRDLGRLTQYQLERKKDPVSAAYIEARFTWGESDCKFEIYDAENGPFYAADIPFDPDVGCSGKKVCPNRKYVIRAELEEHGFRFRINSMDLARIGGSIYDSKIIHDPGVFKRRKGRVGWYAKLIDGDSYIEAIQPTYANFGELRSHAYGSITPVAGAQLFVGASEDRERYVGIYDGPWGGFFEGNPDRGPESFRVINLATEPLQGIRTNYFYVESFAHTDVSFDIYVTQKALSRGSMEAFLWNGSQPIPLPLDGLQGNAWQTVTVNLKYAVDQWLPGAWSLVVVQSIIGTPNDWFLDNISIKARQMEWEGRAHFPDAWDDRDEDWLSFYGTINKANGGVVFKDRSRRFQVRGKALTQTAEVGAFRTVPKYAELGRFVWNDERLDISIKTAPVANFTPHVSGLRVRLDARASDSNGFITSYAWTLGDGAIRNGPDIVYTYAEAGTYPVTLIVTDDSGQRRNKTIDVTVA